MSVKRIRRTIGRLSFDHPSLRCARLVAESAQQFGLEPTIFLQYILLESKSLVNPALAQNINHYC